MAVTVIELSAALRIGDGVTAPVEPIAGILARLLGVAEALVEIDSPSAPALVKDQAVVNLASYLYDMPTAGISERYSRAFRSSGAVDLLSRWRVLRVVGGDGQVGQVIQAGPGQVGSGITDEERARLLPEGATDGQIAVYRTDTGLWVSSPFGFGAHEADPNAHHIPPSDGGEVVTEGIRLPVGTVVMRLGWSQSQVVSDVIFTRADLHPTDGAAVGTVTGTTIPPFPPGLNTDTDLYSFIWIAAESDQIADIRLSGGGGTLRGSFSNGAAYTFKGVDGTVYVSDQRLTAGLSAYSISAIVAGDLIASQPWVTEQDTEQTAAIATMIADAIAAIPAASGFPSAMVGENTALVQATNMWADSGIAIPNTDYFWIEIFIGAVGGVLNLHRKASFDGATAVTAGNAPTTADRIRGDTRTAIQHNFGRFANGNLAVASGTAATYSIRVWR